MQGSTFEFDDISLYRRICGFRDKNLKTIEQAMGVRIIPRGNTLIVDADTDELLGDLTVAGQECIAARGGGSRSGLEVLNCQGLLVS